MATTFFDSFGRQTSSNFNSLLGSIRCGGAELLRSSAPPDGERARIEIVRVLHQATECRQSPLNRQIARKCTKKEITPCKPRPQQSGREVDRLHGQHEEALVYKGANQDGQKGKSRPILQ